MIAGSAVTIESMGLFWWIIIVPVLDLVILAKVMGKLGPPALVWLGLAALLGFLVIRTRTSRFWKRGRAPEGSGLLLDRALITAAGLLFIFPGPLSDVLGLLLLVGPLRARFRDRLADTFLGKLLGSGIGFRFFRTGSPGSPEGEKAASEGAEKHRPFPGSENAREVEFEEIQPKRPVPRS
jgi:UPF0716 protein FxsA